MKIDKIEAVHDSALSGMICACEELLAAWCESGPENPEADISISVNGTEISPYVFAEAMITALDKMAKERADRRIPTAEQAVLDEIESVRLSIVEKLDILEDFVGASLLSIIESMKK